MSQEREPGRALRQGDRPAHRALRAAEPHTSIGERRWRDQGAATPNRSGRANQSGRPNRSIRPNRSPARTGQPARTDPPPQPGSDARADPSASAARPFPARLAAQRIDTPAVVPVREPDILGPQPARIVELSEPRRRLIRDTAATLVARLSGRAHRDRRRAAASRRRGPERNGNPDRLSCESPRALVELQSPEPTATSTATEPSPTPTP